jgi:hypothetical protein
MYRVLLCLTVTVLLLPGCRSDRDYPLRKTEAKLIVLNSHLKNILSGQHSDFAPRNYDDFLAYLRKGDFGVYESEDWHLDGWGHPYLLFVTVIDGERTYLLHSAGADGAHGTRDDLHVIAAPRSVD